MAASSTAICNRALQKLGAKRITSLSDDSVNARACSNAYDATRKALLREYDWSFARGRDSIAADADEPAFGKARSFTLPANCIRVLGRYPEDTVYDTDWEVEERKIFTDESAPLEIRYTKDVTDTTLFDPLFDEALAAELAYELCEELTQSNTKKEALRQDKKDAINRARKSGAIEKISPIQPEDSWVAERD